MIDRYLRNEKGMAIAVVLAILLMLGLIGVAAVRNSTTDMDITEALTNRTKAFYTAEGGLEVAIATLRANGDIVNRDSLLKKINADTRVGSGYFAVKMEDSYPIRTVASLGRDDDGEAAIAVDVRHRRSAANAWNNAIFAGAGQAGTAIAGNVDVHGSVHILGDGEPFTDDNGNGKWDDADTFTDFNGDGIWQPGEPLTADADGDGIWDPAEPYNDDNGNGIFDRTLTATDLSFEATGTAAVRNNYDGIDPVLESRLPGLPTITFNGETVETLDAEMRVKHGSVNLDGTATIGEADVSGGSPSIKETMDGMYINDGYGGAAGTANIYSDNGTNETYDLPEDAVPFPSVNDTSMGYSSHKDYLAHNALVIKGDLTLQPGMSYSVPGNPYGSISLDASGRLSIKGVVMVTGNVYMSPGAGKLGKMPIEYDGRGTLVSGGDMHINVDVISKGKFPTEDVMGFLSYRNMEIGTAGSQLKLMGAFFAQNQITSAKQNKLAGAMVSNFFSITDVPSIYQVPALVDNLPPGMPGGRTYKLYVWKELPATWREL